MLSAVSEPSLIGIAVAARIAGVSKQRMAVLVERPDFPAVALVSSHGRLWHREEVERWARERKKGRPPDLPRGP